MGCRALVGENGFRQSGRQRQRTGIARALYKRAALLVLDEAISALDNQIEYHVVQTIRHANLHAIIGIIANRVNSINFRNKIFELGKGSLEAAQLPIVRN